MSTAPPIAAPLPGANEILPDKPKMDPSAAKNMAENKPASPKPVEPKEAEPSTDADSAITKAIEVTHQELSDNRDTKPVPLNTHVPREHTTQSLSGNWYAFQDFKTRPCLETDQAVFPPCHGKCGEFVKLAREVFSKAQQVQQASSQAHTAAIYARITLREAAKLANKMGNNFVQAESPTRLAELPQTPGWRPWQRTTHSFGVHEYGEQLNSPTMKNLLGRKILGSALGKGLATGHGLYVGGTSKFLDDNAFRAQVYDLKHFGANVDPHKANGLDAFDFAPAPLARDDEHPPSESTQPATEYAYTDADQEGDYGMLFGKFMEQPKHALSSAMGALW
eukprot:GEMP01024481.1.p1 GENE.GEMP01024481.1~~GEMP01024481.1.p1  ORF type:complete len:336 (+),score=83.77 GEMP01024481.1:871-1878(+)